MDRLASPPTWLEELLELLQTRRRLAVVVAAAVAVVGVLLAAIAPGILPPSGGVGAAVGVAACLLAVAAVLGIDAGDLKVRGARHVRAAGADVAAVLRGPPSGPGPAAVVARLDAAGAHRVAVVPAEVSGRDEAVAVVNALGESWARTGCRVLVMDLTRPDDSHAGVVDVVRGTVPLGQAVSFDPELMLARLGAGSDLATALIELPGLAPRLPADIERVVVALPPLADPAARAGAGAMGHVLVLTRVARTSRVDLLATLEALDVGGVDADVLLHEPHADVAPTTADPTGQPAARASDIDVPGIDVPGIDPAGTGPGIGDVEDGQDADATASFDPIAAEDRSDDRSDRGADRGPRPVMAARQEANETPARTSVLGMAEIEEQIETESRRDEQDTGRPLRAVAHEPIANTPPPVAPEPRRPLRAVTGATEADDVTDAMEAAPWASGTPPSPPEPAPTPAPARPSLSAESGGEHDLATTAVLETLAQEIWSRENVGGTA